MIFTLLSLPHEIVGQILDLDGMSPAVIGLWLSGNRAMQYKIVHSVTRIHLVKPGMISANRMPKLLASLRCLAELEVERELQQLSCPDQTAWVLQHLASSLRTLKLYFHDSFYSVMRITPSDSESSSLSDTPDDASSEGAAWSLANAYPRLETLHLDGLEIEWTAVDMDALPSSLTALGNTKITSDYYYQSSVVAALPRGLRYWNIQSDDLHAIAWAHLPRGLLDLHLSNIDSSWRLFQDTPPPEIVDLPPTLTRLCLDNGWPLQDHPKSLQELDYRTVIDASKSDFSEFKSLTTLGTPGYLFPVSLKSIDTLPNSVASMYIDLAPVSSPVKKWPDALRSLCLGYREVQEFSLLALPSNLTRLSYLTARHMFSSINLVPKNLTYLNMSFQLEPNDDIEFPSTLTYLSLLPLSPSLIVKPEAWCSHCPRDSKNPHHFLRLDWSSTQEYSPPKVTMRFPFHKLPGSITKLKLKTYVPASQLKYLPRRLVSLEVSGIFKDADFDPKSAVEREAMFEMYEAGRAEGIRHLLDCDALTEATIFGLLPRTLKRLTADARGTTHNAAWRELPTELVKINFSQISVPIDSDALLKMPMHRLRSFEAALVDIKDEHLAALPRDLLSFSIQIKTSASTSPPTTLLTRKSIFYVPPSITIGSWMPEREMRNAHHKLTNARLVVMKEADTPERAELLKCLLSQDEQAMIDKGFAPYEGGFQ